MQETDDATLVACLVTRPQDALADAYRRHAGAVFGLARRLLADRTFAEEVTQEVFLRLWRDPGRYDADRGSLRSFLLAQCHGRSVDFIRAETSRRRREDDAVDRRSEDAPEDAACDRTVADRVIACLHLLPDGEREAISLAYLGGHTYREVAELLDTPEGTVKGRIRRGLRRMHDELICEELTGAGETAVDA